MSKKLVIVESPGKTKSVESYLGKDYIAIASFGHFMDLPSKELSVDVNNNFEPTYSILPGKAKIVTELKSKYSACSDVYIATDKDREGEMIAWCIAKVLGLKNPKRLLFKSITKAELQTAIANPTTINQNTVDAQKARRILDRIVGYYLSPLLCKHVQPRISAGRVQSVITRLIVEKEQEIEKFLGSKLVPYFRFTGEFNIVGENISCSMSEFTKFDIESSSTEHAKIESIELARDVMKDLTTSKYKIRDIIRTNRTSHPPEPFTTAALQQEASTKYGFTGKRTMSAAQRLYEASLITYMRTDSSVLSEVALQSIKSIIEEKYGENYYRKSNAKKSKGKTQDAHEAIRPTNIKIDRIGSNSSKKLGNDEIRLYDLIWKRTIASQMKPAEYDVMIVRIIGDKLKMYCFETEYKNIIFQGFKIVYGKEENVKFPIIKEGDIIPIVSLNTSQDYPKPPARYSESSLINKMSPKNLNIGRPATYASMIDKIQSVKYVEIKNVTGVEKESTKMSWKAGGKIKEQPSKVIIGNDNKKFVPTFLGGVVTEYLIKRFPSIMDYKFTADMENKLDEIESGKEVWYKVLEKFHNDFKPVVDKVYKEKTLVQTKYERVLGKYPGTNEDVILAHGFNGPYVRLSETKYKKGPVKKPLTFETVTLKDAISILEYPKVLGKMGNAIVYLKTNNDSFYVDVAGKTKSVPNEKVTLDDVVKIMNEPDKAVLKQFEDGGRTYQIRNHKENGDYIMIKDGSKKKVKTTFVGFPKGEKVDVDKLTLEKVKQYVDQYYEKKKSYKPRKKFTKKK